MSAPDRDSEGFLLDLSCWNKTVSAHIAAEEGIVLTDAHHEIIFALREFYQTFGLSPAMRPFCKYLKEKLGAEKSTSIYLLGLFPGSPAKLAAKIAGLPKPDNCL
jgi:tRNA 2-thiouridine synthesizing protein E